MKRSLGVKLVLLVVVLASASLACNIFGNTKTSKGERVFSNANGFSLSPPAGTVVGNLGIIGLEVSAAKVDKSGDVVLGPKCTAGSHTKSGHEDLKEATKNYWIGAIASDKYSVGLDLGPYQVTSVAGYFAAEGVESGAFVASIDPKTTPIYGMQLDAEVAGNQIFVMTCDGPASRKAETLSLYNALKGSLQFFSPITETPIK